MTKPSTWVVRVCLRRDETYDLRFVEIMHWAGAITIYEDNDQGMRFDVFPPVGVGATGSKAWAETAALKSRAYGFEAVATDQEMK